MDLKSNLFTIASDIRYFILSGFQTLPLTLGGMLLIVSHFAGNYAMIFFLTGYLMLVPAITFGINLASGMFGFTSPAGVTFPGGGKDSEVCNVLPVNNTLKYDMIISYWMAMISFFIGYMMTNAVAIYQMEPINPTEIDPTGNSNPATAAAISSGVALRKSNTINAMAVIIAFTLIVIYIRVFYSGCDWGEFSLVTVLSVLIAFGFGGLGYSWYKMLEGVDGGNSRLADLFGIANRMMIPPALVNAPYACLPQA